ncbi:MAG TPA: hypothetical protein VGJ95_03890 [Pseudonocardiaceae bacterium]
MRAEFRELAEAMRAAAAYQMLTLAPDADPFVGPDQRALEELLATFELEPAVAG